LGGPFLFALPISPSPGLFRHPETGSHTAMLIGISGARPVMPSNGAGHF